MAKFVFQLEAVLRQRTRDEQERQRVLADVQAEMVRLETKLRELDTNVQSNMTDLRDNRLVGTLDMRFLAAHRRFVGAVRQEAMGVVQQMARHQVKVEEAQRNLAEAAKQRKIIEKLRERALDRWRGEQSHKELLQADEAATQLSYRATAARLAEEASS